MGSGGWGAPGGGTGPGVRHARLAVHRPPSPAHDAAAHTVRPLLGVGRQVPVRVAQAYLEFVERRPLPGLEGTPHGALSEAQRRDGFEASSADNIFASTTLAATRGR